MNLKSAMNAYKLLIDIEMDIEMFEFFKVIVSVNLNYYCLSYFDYILYFKDKLTTVC